MIFQPEVNFHGIHHCRRTCQKSKVNKCRRIFFEKNRQILGFDSAPRSLITTVKEAVDNSLDACEEAGILPDILVQIERTGQDYVTVIIEDNGPGIIKEQIPKVFAKTSLWFQVPCPQAKQGTARNRDFCSRALFPDDCGKADENPLQNRLR